MGDYDEALRYSRLALEINPQSAEVRIKTAAAENNYGAVLLGRGQASKAIEFFKNALRLMPDYALAYNNMGKALADLGNSAEAIENFEKAIKLDPDFVGACNNLAIAFTKAGRINEATAQYQHALKIDPSSIDTHFNYGLMLLNAGQFPAAAEQFQKAIRLKPDYAQAWANLAPAYAMQQKLDDAEAAALKALALAQQQGNAPLAEQVQAWLSSHKSHAH